MVEFSANLGFLWTDRPLSDAILSAADAGFHAVECHWPYDHDAGQIADSLAQAGLPMLGLNTRKGDVANGENGVAALPGREAEARRYIDEAIAYAKVTGTGNVHVMAGRTDKGAAASQTFCDNLAYATQTAAAHNITILIEPLNHRDAPDYHLQTAEEAGDIIDRVGADNLKMMFDCYHLQIMGGDLLMRAKTFMPQIGHIQFASVPERAEPDKCELNYSLLLPAFYEAGYQGYVGAEYKPSSPTAESLGWMAAYR